MRGGGSRVGQRSGGLARRRKDRYHRDRPLPVNRPCDDVWEDDVDEEVTASS